MPARKLATSGTSLTTKPIEAYKKALALKPDDAAVYNQMGNIYGAQKKIPEATEAFTKAAQFESPDGGQGLFQHGCEPGELRFGR